MKVEELERFGANFKCQKRQLESKIKFSVRIEEKDHHNSQKSINYRKGGIKMTMSVRKNPLVCLLLSLGRVLIGRLKYSKEYVGTTLKMENGEAYRIFRHVRSVPQSHDEQGPVFIVNFKFARLSQKANRFVSQVPMLLITGFPGFRVKMYAVNQENGYWLGIYQWESKHALDAYKQSLVLRIMNSRAIDGSVTYNELDHYCLTDYIVEHKIDETLSSSKKK